MCIEDIYAYANDAYVRVDMHVSAYVCICMRSIGGSSHTSSGGSPSHVSRGENVPPACRKGR